jgi:hypothetical protein
MFLVQYEGMERFPPAEQRSPHRSFRQAGDILERGHYPAIRYALRGVIHTSDGSGGSWTIVQFSSPYFPVFRTTK